MVWLQDMDKGKNLDLKNKIRIRFLSNYSFEFKFQIPEDAFDTTNLTDREVINVW